MIKRFLCGIVVLIAFQAISHPLKSTMTDIRLDKEGNGYVRMNLFYDDFSAYIIKRYKKNINWASPTKKEWSFIRSYFKSQFSLAINGKEMKYKFKSLKLEGNVLQLKLEFGPVDYVEGKTEFEIENTILIDEFKDQGNVVRIDAKGNRMPLGFTCDKARGTTQKLLL